MLTTVLWGSSLTVSPVAALRGDCAPEHRMGRAARAAIGLVAGAIWRRTHPRPRSSITERGKFDRVLSVV